MVPNESLKEGPDVPLMTREEQLQLYRMKVERELQDRLIGWAQLRLAVVAGVVSLLISGGVFYSLNAAVKEVVQTETSREIKAMEAVRQRATSDMDAARQRAMSEMDELHLQKKLIDRLVEDTRAELRLARADANATKAEANEVMALVRNTRPEVDKMIADMKRLRVEAEDEQKRAKENSFSVSQYLQETQFRARGDMIEMRANIELLERGFSIIEDLASAIRKKEPRSELARQFAGFSSEWDEARKAYEQRISDLRRRRALKIIHYAHSEASPERQRRTLEVVNRLQEAGYTVEEWLTPKGQSDFDAAAHVAREFGIADPKPLLGVTLVIHPKTAEHFTDIKSILEKIGINIPAAEVREIVPQKQDILTGIGSFKAESVVLLSDLGKR